MSFSLSIQLPTSESTFRTVLKKLAYADSKHVALNEKGKITTDIAKDAFATSGTLFQRLFELKFKDYCAQHEKLINKEDLDLIEKVAKKYFGQHSELIKFVNCMLDNMSANTYRFQDVLDDSASSKKEHDQEEGCDSSDGGEATSDDQTFPFSQQSQTLNQQIVEDIKEDANFVILKPEHEFFFETIANNTLFSAKNLTMLAAGTISFGLAALIGKNLFANSPIAEKINNEVDHSSSLSIKQSSPFSDINCNDSYCFISLQERKISPIRPNQDIHSYINAQIKTKSAASQKPLQDFVDDFCEIITENSTVKATSHKVEVKKMVRQSQLGPGRDDLATLPQFYEQLPAKQLNNNITAFKINKENRFEKESEIVQQNQEIGSPSLSFSPIESSFDRMIASLAAVGVFIGTIFAVAWSCTKNNQADLNSDLNFDSDLNNEILKFPAKKERVVPPDENVNGSKENTDTKQRDNPQQLASKPNSSKDTSQTKQKESSLPLVKNSGGSGQKTGSKKRGKSQHISQESSLDQNNTEGFEPNLKRSTIMQRRIENTLQPKSSQMKQPEIKAIDPNLFMRLQKNQELTVESNGKIIKLIETTANIGVKLNEEIAKSKKQNFTPIIYELIEVTQAVFMFFGKLQINKECLETLLEVCKFIEICASKIKNDRIKESLKPIFEEIEKLQEKPKGVESKQQIKTKNPITSFNVPKEKNNPSLGDFFPQTQALNKSLPQNQSKVNSQKSQEQQRQSLYVEEILANIPSEYSKKPVELNDKKISAQIPINLQQILEEKDISIHDLQETQAKMDSGYSALESARVEEKLSDSSHINSSTKINIEEKAKISVETVTIQDQPNITNLDLVKINDKNQSLGQNQDESISNRIQYEEKTKDLLTSGQENSKTNPKKINIEISKVPIVRKKINCDVSIEYFEAKAPIENPTIDLILSENFETDDSLKSGFLAQRNQNEIILEENENHMDYENQALKGITKASVEDGLDTSIINSTEISFEEIMPKKPVMSMNAETTPHENKEALNLITNNNMTQSTHQNHDELILNPERNKKKGDLKNLVLKTAIQAPIKDKVKKVIVSSPSKSGETVQLNVYKASVRIQSNFFKMLGDVENERNRLTDEMLQDVFENIYFLSMGVLGNLGFSFDDNSSLEKSIPSKIPPQEEIRTLFKSCDNLNLCVDANSQNMCFFYKIDPTNVELNNVAVQTKWLIKLLLVTRNIKEKQENYDAILKYLKFWLTHQKQIIEKNLTSWKKYFCNFEITTLKNFDILVDEVSQSDPVPVQRRLNFSEKSKTTSLLLM
jgi:hypothetical protein